MEGYCLTGQSPQWAVVPTEEAEEGASLPYDKNMAGFQNIMHV